MPSKTMLLSVLMSFMFLSVSPRGIDPSPARDSVQRIERDIAEVYLMVYEAHKNGVDQENIKPLIIKLNEAIRLLEEAIQCMPDESATKSEYYLNAATSLIYEERSRAETVLALSIRRSFQMTILTWILLPLLSLLSTLVVVKLYGVYVARQRRTFLRMSIKKKQREKSKSR